MNNKQFEMVACDFKLVIDALVKCAVVISN